jgi:hypothetical protein
MECLENNPLIMVQFSEGFTKARGNTFDKNGNVKLPPLIGIYAEILLHLPEVEDMSGVTEFCEFLKPLLNEKDPVKRLERVKQIRRRLGIVFKGKVKGKKTVKGTAKRHSPYLPKKT